MNILTDDCIWYLVYNNRVGLCIVFSWKPLLYYKTMTWLWTRAYFKHRLIFKRKSLQLLLLLESGRKTLQFIGEMCIYNNPFFVTDFFTYFEKNSTLNFNAVFSLGSVSNQCWLDCSKKIHNFQSFQISVVQCRYLNENRQKVKHICKEVSSIVLLFPRPANRSHQRRRLWLDP